MRLSIRQISIALLLAALMVGSFAVAETTYAREAGSSQNGTTVPIVQEDPGYFEAWIYDISIGLGGIVLQIGGWLLDMSVQYLVVGMGEFMASGIGLTVDTLWVLMRDIFNILFIFGLIYIGFRTILFSDDSGTKRALGWLIVAALLINFSLFITKSVVDFTNVTAYQFYVNMQHGTNIAANANDPVDLQTHGVSGAFMDAFKFTTYAKSDVIKNYAGEQVSLGRHVIYGLVMMFTMIIAGFVFGAGAFLMLSRFVGLIIFMILSPAMFLGFVFPSRRLQNLQDLWWSKFLKYAFVAPAYLFMLYLAQHVLVRLGLDGSFAGAFNANETGIAGGAFLIFLNFAIVAGFLIAAVVVANMLGVYGASASVGMLKSADKYVRTTAKRAAGAATFGVAAAGGRATFGQAAHRISESVKLKNYAANSTIGKGLLRASRGVADSSFDARKVGAVKSLGAGEGRKGGVSTIIKERVDKEKKFAESLGTLDIKDTENAALVEKQTEAARADVTKAKEAVASQEEELKKKRAEMTQATASDREKVATLNNELKDPATTAERKQEIENEMLQVRNSIVTTERSFAEELRKLTEDVTVARTELKDKRDTLKEKKGIAETEVKYKRQIEYMDKLKKNAEFFGGKVGLGGGAAGGATVAFLASTGVAVGYAASGAGAGAGYLAGKQESYVGMQAHKALMEKYGKNAEKMNKEKKDKQRASILKELADEAGGTSEPSGGETKKEDGEKKDAT